ncbi:MAG TPA: hypothetical protein VJN50_10480 [Actinomycetota bacterium]|nr:hypothetical protein [Actinomycetota bacterium]
MSDERPPFRGSSDSLPRALAAELSKLDPWSFWSVPLVGDRVAVIGTTGAFLVALNEDEGYLEVRGRRGDVGGKRIGGLRGLRREAKMLRDRISSFAVYTPVEPVVCLSRGVAGGPRPLGGVTVVPLGDLARHVAGREKVLHRDRARRAAERLAGPP